MVCSTNNSDDNSQKLFNLLASQLIFDTNIRIKVAACELISNFSLCEALDNMASDLDLDCNN